MRILVVCGNGLGSSLIMEMNVKKSLERLGKEADVDHSDLASAKTMPADVYIGAADIMARLSGDGRITVALKNMMSIDEISAKLGPYLV